MLGQSFPEGLHPMLEQLVENCSLGVRPTLELFMKGCILWVTTVEQGQSVRRKEQQKKYMMKWTEAYSPSLLPVGRRWKSLE